MLSDIFCRQAVKGFPKGYVMIRMNNGAGIVRGIVSGPIIRGKFFLFSLIKELYRPYSCGPMDSYPCNVCAPIYRPFLAILP